MTWLTVKKIAALCDIDQSTVKKAVKAGRCQSRYVEGIGRGGRQLEIAVETIPWEITENDTKARLKIANMPKRQVFFRHMSLI